MDWKEILKPDWHLVGLLPLVFGLVSYVIAIANSVPLWGFLWVCPLTAILTGIVLPSRNRFAISALAAWIFNGPLMPALADTANMLQLSQLHHFMSAAVLLVIMYHWKEIWDGKGILFGVASFYAFVVITLNLSGGVVNLLEPLKNAATPPLWYGAALAVLSVAILLWYKFGSKSVEKPKV